MSGRLLFVAAALGALCACGQAQQAEAPATAERPAPVDVAQSTSRECARARAPGPEVTLQSHGAAVGYAVSATPGALACSEPGLEGAVECEFTGPGQVLVSGATTAAFTIDAGQTATLVVGPSGPQCHLNANGE
jgi:hypothetical protein